MAAFSPAGESDAASSTIRHHRLLGRDTQRSMPQETRLTDFPSLRSAERALGTQRLIHELVLLAGARAPDPARGGEKARPARDARSGTPMGEAALRPLQRPRPRAALE